MSNDNSLLIIDDDTELCELLEDYLRGSGFSVDCVHDGTAGVERAASAKPALIILDVMLPGLDGFEVLRRIRAASATPVIMLTARGDDIDRIVGLELGADDYLPKPFNPRELVARIHAVLRRAETAPRAAQTALPAGELCLYPGQRRATLAGAELSLTSVEFDLLRVLLEQQGQVVSREQLVAQALGRQLAACDRSVDVHISAIRRKLGTAADNIRTVRGVGYLYRAAGADD